MLSAFVKWKVCENAQFPKSFSASVSQNSVESAGFSKISTQEN